MEMFRGWKILKIRGFVEEEEGGRGSESTYVDLENGDVSSGTAGKKKRWLPVHGASVRCLGAEVPPLQNCVGGGSDSQRETLLSPFVVLLFFRSCSSNPSLLCFNSNVPPSSLTGPRLELALHLFAIPAKPAGATGRNVGAIGELTILGCVSGGLAFVGRGVLNLVWWWLVVVVSADEGSDFECGLGSVPRR